MAKTEAELRRIIKEYVQALEDEIRVSRVILYGSYAHGHPDEWSDVDIAVISPDFDSLDQWERQGLLGRKRLGCDLALEALGYSSEEYENAHHLTFLGEIKRMGKVVYEVE
jgi:hypothetical protein